MGVSPDASAENESGIRTIVVGADVSIGERVITNATGLVQLLFDDETRLVVGPNSTLLIEDYVLRRDGTAGRFAINALTGTFRFVTGKSPKNSYEITTPTGTIGVRGTAFDFYIGPLRIGRSVNLDIATLVLLFEGIVDLCNTGGDCTAVEVRCDYAAASNQGAGIFADNAAARAAFRALFPFAQAPGMLIEDFRIVGASECVEAALNTSVPSPTTQTVDPQTTRTLPDPQPPDPNVQQPPPPPLVDSDPPPPDNRTELTNGDRPTTDYLAYD
jgi:hypothetical protein